MITVVTAYNKWVSGSLQLVAHPNSPSANFRYPQPLSETHKKIRGEKMANLKETLEMVIERMKISRSLLQSRQITEHQDFEL